MIKALLFKEWLKLRPVFWLAAVLQLAAAAFVLADLRRLFRLEHPETLWYQAAALGHVHFELFRPLGWLCGLALAAAQFLPEIRRKRLRIALHLPLRPEMTLAWSLAAGLAGLGLLLGGQSLAVWGLEREYFPSEIVRLHLLALAPWQGAALAVYLGAAMVLLEPGVTRRAASGLILLGLVAPVLAQASPGAAAPLLPWLGAALPLLALGTLASVHRFRFTGK